MLFQYFFFHFRIVPSSLYPLRPLRPLLPHRPCHFSRPRAGKAGVKAGGAAKETPKAAFDFSGKTAAPKDAGPKAGGFTFGAKAGAKAAGDTTKETVAPKAGAFTFGAKTGTSAAAKEAAPKVGDAKAELKVDSKAGAKVRLPCTQPFITRFGLDPNRFSMRRRGRRPSRRRWPKRARAPPGPALARKRRPRRQVASDETNLFALMKKRGYRIALKNE